MSIIRKVKTLGRLQKIALAAVLLFLAYTFFGFLVLPWVAKLVAVHKLPQVLHRPTVIEKVRFNPFTLALEVQGFTLRERSDDATFISFDRLLLDIQASSIVKLAPVVREFRLEKPYGRIKRAQDGTFNFSDLLSPQETNAPSPPQPTPSAPAKKPAFCLYNIQIVDGAVDFIDDPVAKTHEVRSFNLGLPFISSIGEDIEVFVQPYFSAKLNGTPLSIKGKTKPFSPSLETVFAINLKEVDLPYYVAYAPKDVPVTLTSGSLDVALQLSFVQPRNEMRKLILSGDVAVHNVAVVDKAQRPLCKFGSLDLTIAPSELFARKPHLAKIALQSPELVLIRDAAGTLNVNALAPPVAQSPEPAAPTEPALPLVLTIDEITVNGVRAVFQDYQKTSGSESPEELEILQLPSLALRNTTIDTGARLATVGELAAEQATILIRKLKTGELSLAALAPPAPTGTTEDSLKAESGAPWVATLEKLSIKDFSIQGENLASLPGGDLSLTAISLEGQGITTRVHAKSSIDFSALINQKAPLEVRGELGLSPLVADLQLSLRKLKLVWFEPFFADRIALSIPKGEFSTAGTVLVALPENAPMQATFRGDADMADFIAVDKKDAQDILKWKQLQIKNIDFNLSPLTASVDTVSLENFGARIVRNADQSFNLQHLLTASEKAEEAPAAGPAATQEPAAPAPAEPAKVEAPRIAVNTVALKGGTVHFSDRAVTPAFYTKLTEIQGGVTGISSEENATANVDITAKCDGYAPIAIKGSARPLSKELYLDLATQLRGLDMTIFSTYTGKYVGHTIGEGKLGLDLRYHIKGKSFKSENAVQIDTFNFGQKVESPDDLKLPVKLAVSLLKDRNGKIDLNLPVSGRLDDPKFSMFGLIMKVLKNVLVKAATSPFSLLSSVFGGGEDLSYIEFTPGTSALTDALKQKLDKLAAALYDRPSLKLRVAGYADPEQDRQGLIDYRFERQLKAQKFRALPEAEAATDHIDAVTVAPEEREKYLRKAYKAADFEKPKNLVGLAKDLPPEEMEKLMRENISVTDEDLAVLAQERSQTVVSYLTEQGKVEASRIFLVRPKSLAPKKKIENVSNARVDLRLK